MKMNNAANSGGVTCVLKQIVTKITVRWLWDLLSEIWTDYIQNQ